MEAEWNEKQIDADPPFGSIHPMKKITWWQAFKNLCLLIGGRNHQCYGVFEKWAFMGALAFPIGMLVVVPTNLEIFGSVPPEAPVQRADGMIYSVKEGKYKACLSG